jgi:UDP-glucose:(heptosyl)LPS alpha-1,3-glucosyltransferase
MLASDVADPDPRLIRRHIPMVRPNNPLQMASFNLASTLALQTWLRREQYDIVHGHGCATLAQDVVTAHSCHRAWVQQSRHTVRPFTRAWLLKRLNPQHPTIQFLEQVQYQPDHYQQIIAVSEGIKAELTTHYPIPPERITVIPNGVNLDEFHPQLIADHRAAVRARLGLTDEDRVLLFVANEFPRKGLDTILEALARLGDPRLTLLVVGRGDADAYRSRIGQMGLTPQVRFIPGTTAVAPYYAASDLFVFPTLYEPFGLVIIEALACGLPVVTSACAGAGLAVNAANGRLLDEPRDAAALAEHIRTLLARPAAEVIPAARRAAERYSWDRIAGEYLQVYERVADRRARVGRDYA